LGDHKGRKGDRGGEEKGERRERNIQSRRHDRLDGFGLAVLRAGLGVGGAGDGGGVEEEQEPCGGHRCDGEEGVVDFARHFRGLVLCAGARREGRGGSFIACEGWSGGANGS
jgi:hypothetical protein